MAWFNRKFIKLSWHGPFQIALAIVFMFFILVALNFASTSRLLELVGATSLAASVFIAFSHRYSVLNAPRHMIGGYVIALVMGLGMHFLELHHYFLPLAYGHLLVIISAAIAVGITMLLMVLMKLEHPPAMGFALALVLERWDSGTVIVVMIAIILLAGFKKILDPLIYDLD